jgi:two-component system, NarL family, response regulator DesR
MACASSTVAARTLPSALVTCQVPLKHEVERARALGAYGYLSKSAPEAKLLEAIRGAHSGRTTYAQIMEKKLSPDHHLSMRESEVLEYLGRGLVRQDIAKALNISAETVKTHVKSILNKLQAGNRTEAVARAYELGLLG